MRRPFRHYIWLTAHAVAQRPWMAKLAKHTLAGVPFLGQRLRRLVIEAQPLPAPPAPEILPERFRREDSLTAAEARVLVDLRQALADRQEHAP